MTLGRTANAIKIKTDGGLRAVNCACCPDPDPCNGDEWNPWKEYGGVITKDQYLAWLRGGTISVGGTVSDSYGGIADPPCPPYDVCSWSYSTSISVPAKTCTLNFSHFDTTVSCVSAYYSQTQYPSMYLKVGAYRSNEPGEVYRAQLQLGIFCPTLFRGCQPLPVLDLGCYSNGFYGLGATAPWLNSGDSSLSFLGATFLYYSYFPERGNVTPTASLNFTFTPN